jgi:NAD(P)-dependent dehydrogenase (short-subunit alcohol dehydrogenase family)
MMSVNLESAVWISRAALPLMARRNYGRFIVTISGHGLFPSYDAHDVAAYSITKAALFGLTNQLAAEGAPHGITANALSPVAATRIYRRQVPQGTVTPEQITPGVLYLASERCTASGMVLRANNGRIEAGWFGRTEGVDFGPEPATPEEIEARWGEIAAGPLVPLG